MLRARPARGVAAARVRIPFVALRLCGADEADGARGEADGGGGAGNGARHGAGRGTRGVTDGATGEAATGGTAVGVGGAGEGDAPASGVHGGRLAGANVLVVDDSRTVRRSARSCLEAEGCRVETAADGFEALAAIVRARPDVVVADIVMPRLDGYQVCALVRNNAEFADLPVLLLSSRDGLFDRARGRVVGATDHIAKPFDAGALVGAVAVHLGAVENAGAGAAPPADVPPPAGRAAAADAVPAGVP